MGIKGILFNTEMVRAILDGRKTVTRRAIKPRYRPDEYGFVVCTNKATGEVTVEKMDEDGGTMFDDGNTRYVNPPYRPGDILYVRETWTCRRTHRYEANADIKYKAGGADKRIYFSNGNTDNPCRNDYDSFVNKWYSYEGKWRPSIHMPKEAARIWLKVTDVRVERLQDMGRIDFLKEGMILPHDEHADLFLKMEFKRLWDSTIKGEGLSLYGWDANPWVWVIEFERTEKPDEN